MDSVSSPGLSASQSEGLLHNIGYGPGSRYSKCDYAMSLKSAPHNTDKYLDTININYKDWSFLMHAENKWL